MEEEKEGNQQESDNVPQQLNILQNTAQPEQKNSDSMYQIPDDEDIQQYQDRGYLVEKYSEQDINNTPFQKFPLNIPFPQQGQQQEEEASEEESYNSEENKTIVNDDQSVHQTDFNSESDSGDLEDKEINDYIKQAEQQEYNSEEDIYQQNNQDSQENSLIEKDQSQESSFIQDQKDIAQQNNLIMEESSNSYSSEDQLNDNNGSQSNDLAILEKGQEEDQILIEEQNNKEDIQVDNQNNDNDSYDSDQELQKQIEEQEKQAKELQLKEQEQKIKDQNEKQLLEKEKQQQQELKKNQQEKKQEEKEKEGIKAEDIEIQETKEIKKKNEDEQNIQEENKEQDEGELPPEIEQEVEDKIVGQDIKDGDENQYEASIQDDHNQEIQLDSDKPLILNPNYKTIFLCQLTVAKEYINNQRDGQKQRVVYYEEINTKNKKVQSFRVSKIEHNIENRKITIYYFRTNENIKRLSTYKTLQQGKQIEALKLFNNMQRYCELSKIKVSKDDAYQFPTDESASEQSDAYSEDDNVQNFEQTIKLNKTTEDEEYEKQLKLQQIEQEKQIKFINNFLEEEEDEAEKQAMLQKQKNEEQNEEKKNIEKEKQQEALKKLQMTQGTEKGGLNKIQQLQALTAKNINNKEIEQQKALVKQEKQNQKEAIQKAHNFKRELIQKQMAQQQELEEQDDDEVKKPNCFKRYFCCCLLKKQNKQQEPEEIRDAQKQFDKLCKLRVIFRTCMHFILTFLVLAIFIGYYYGSYLNGVEKIEFTKNQFLKIQTENCLVNLIQSSNPMNTQLQIDYTMHKAIWPFPQDGENDDSNSNIKITDSIEGVEIKARSAYQDLKFCYVEIMIPKLSNNESYGDFSFQCTDISKCAFAYKGDQITFKNISFESTNDLSHMVANIENVKFDSINFKAQNIGMLYLQHFQLTGNSNTQNSISTNHGEIVLQSTQNYQFSFTNPYQAICYTAPVIQQIAGQEFLCAMDTNKSQTDITTSANYVEDSENITCNGGVKLCLDENSCDDNIPNFNISVNQSGNIYANIIEKIGEPPQGSQIIAGEIFTNGIQYNEELQEEIQFINESGDVQTEPIYIVDLGDKYSQQTSHSLWVKSSNPSYAQMRPWWLATFSLKLLVTQTYNLSGYLSPGFCPYSTNLNLSQYFEMKQFLYSSLKNTEQTTDRSSVTFIQQQDKPLPIDGTSTGSGVNIFEKDLVNVNESWYNIVEKQQELKIENYSINQNGQILGSLIASILVSIAILIYVMYILYKLLPFFKERLSNVSGQFAKYTSTQAANKKKEENQNQDDLTFDVEIKNKKQEFSPSFLSTLDFQNYLYTRKKANSAAVFFSTMFQRADDNIEQNLLNGEIESEQYLEIKERKLKNLYEKFCYLNHLTEKRLTDEGVTELLEDTYGYVWQPDPSACQIFLKIKEKRKPENFYPDPALLKQKSSLDLFISTYYEITGRESDEVWVEDMRNNYINFCTEFRIKQQEFNIDNIIKKYNVDVTMKTQQKLVMKKTENSQSSKLTFKDKLFNKLNLKRDKHGKYLIQLEQLELHVQLMSDQASYTMQHLLQLGLWKILWNEFWDIVQTFIRARINITFTQEESAFMSTIYGELWMITDILIVIQHFILNAILIAPVFLFVVINQISYAPYSLNHPSNLFTQEDLEFATVYFPWYISNCDITMFISLIIIFLFFFVQTFAEALLFWRSKFPIDRAFEEEKRKRGNWQATFQWIFMMIFISFAIFYISMNMLWLLLGAIINPNYFLVYATSVVTLITFVTSKKQAFDEIYNGGLDIIKNILLKEYSKKVQGIIASIEAEKSALISKVEDMVEEGEQMFIETASVVGLGSEAQQLIKNVESKFPNVDQLSIEDLDPTKIEKKAEELKVELKEQALEQIKKELLQHGISEEFCQAIFKLVIEDDKDGASKLIASEVGKGSDEKLPSKLIEFILDSVLNHKQFDPRSMSKQLQYSIIDVILQTFMGKESKDLQLNIRKLILLIMNLIQALQTQDLSQIMEVFKELMFLIPLQEGQDWTYSPTPTFILKFLEILQKIFSGQTNSQEMGQLIQICLQMAQIPQEIGLFLSIMLPANKNNQKWQYGDIKIESTQQLRNFIETNIIQKIGVTDVLNPKQGKLLSYVFTSVFKQLRRDVNFEPEITYFRKVIQTQIDVGIPNEILDVAELVANFVPLAVKRTESIDQQIQNLSSETGFPINHIKGLIFTGTTGLHFKLNQYGIYEGLMDDYTCPNFLPEISSSLGIKKELFLGFLQVYNGYIGTKQDYYQQKITEDFLQFIYKTYQIKSQSQQIMIQVIYKLMFCKSMWEVEKIFNQFLENEEIKKYLQTQQEQDKNFQLKVYKIWENYLKNGDIEQLSNFLTKSYTLVRKNRFLRNFLSKFEPKDETLKEHSALFLALNKDLEGKEKKQSQNEKNNKRKSLTAKLLIKRNSQSQKNKDKKNTKQTENEENEEKQIELQNLKKKESSVSQGGEFKLDSLQKSKVFSEFICQHQLATDNILQTKESLQKVFDSAQGKGHYSLCKIKKVKQGVSAISIIDFIIDQFAAIGLNTKVEKLLKLIFKVGYLSVDKLGYHGNDRLNLIETCGQALKVNNVIMNQMLSFFSINNSISVQNITEFYVKNPQLLEKCIGEDFIKQSCSTVLHFIWQYDKFNPSSLNFLKQSKFQKSKLLPTKFLTQFMGSKDIFQYIASNSTMDQLVDKEKICFMIESGLNFLREDLKLISQQNQDDIQQIIFQILHINQTLDYETLHSICGKVMGEFKIDGVSEKSMEHNVNHMIKLFLHVIEDRNIAALNEVKEISLHLLKSLGMNQSIIDICHFIYDIIAILNVSDFSQSISLEQQYKPAPQFQRFYEFIPLLKYRFIKNPEKFAIFASQICKSLFKFDSITSHELNTLFSLFGNQPKRDEASALLNIDTHIIELGVGIAQLIVGEDIGKSIDNFINYKAFNMLCKKGNLIQQEVELLLKLSLRKFKLEDLQHFFETFGMKDHIDIQVLKGFFAFMLPPPDNLKVSQDVLRDQYLRNYNSRKHLFNKLTERDTKSFKSTKISEQYEIFELFYNIKHGRFYNILYQIQEHKTLQKAQIFGGQKFLKYSISGILGFLQNQQRKIIIPSEGLEEQFSLFRKDQNAVPNSLLGSFYLMSESIFQYVFEYQYVGQALSETPLEYSQVNFRSQQWEKGIISAKNDYKSGQNHMIKCTFCKNKNNHQFQLGLDCYEKNQIEMDYPEYFMCSNCNEYKRFASKSKNNTFYHCPCRDSEKLQGFDLCQDCYYIKPRLSVINNMVKEMPQDKNMIYYYDFQIQELSYTTPKGYQMGIGFIRQLNLAQKKGKYNLGPGSYMLFQNGTITQQGKRYKKKSELKFNEGDTVQIEINHKVSYITFYINNDRSKKIDVPILKHDDYQYQPNRVAVFFYNPKDKVKLQDRLYINKEELNNLEKFKLKKLINYINYNLTYAQKFKIIESKFLVDFMQQVAGKLSRTKDQQKLEELMNDPKLLTEKFGPVFQKNFQHLDLRESLTDHLEQASEYIYQNLSNYYINHIQLILMATMQQCRQNLVDYQQSIGKLYQNSERSYQQLVLDLDLILNCVGKLYILNNKTEKVEEFRKNYLLELLSLILINQVPQYCKKQKFDIFKKVYNQLIPSNPSCYLLEGSEFKNIFTRFIYPTLNKSKQQNSQSIEDITELNFSLSKQNFLSGLIQYDDKIDKNPLYKVEVGLDSQRMQAILVEASIPRIKKKETIEYSIKAEKINKKVMFGICEKKKLDFKKDIQLRGMLKAQKIKQNKKNEEEENQEVTEKFQQQLKIKIESAGIDKEAFRDVDGIYMIDDKGEFYNNKVQNSGEYFTMDGNDIINCEISAKVFYEFSKTEKHKGISNKDQYGIQGDSKKLAHDNYEKIVLVEPSLEYYQKTSYTFKLPKNISQDSSYGIGIGFGKILKEYNYEVKTKLPQLMKNCIIVQQGKQNVISEDENISSIENNINFTAKGEIKVTVDLQENTNLILQQGDNILEIPLTQILTDDNINNYEKNPLYIYGIVKNEEDSLELVDNEIYQVNYFNPRTYENFSHNFTFPRDSSNSLHICLAMEKEDSLSIVEGQSKKITQFYEEFISTYSKLYLNDTRFFFIDTLQSEMELSYQQDKFRNMIYIAKQTLKCNLGREVEYIENQDTTYNITTAQQNNYMFLVSQRAGFIQKQNSSLDNIRQDIIKIITKNLNTYKSNFLSVQGGVQNIIENVFINSPGVLGTKATKNLIINILRIIKEEENNNQLIQDILGQLVSMRSNAQNIQEFLCFFINYNEDATSINKFLQIFVEKKYYKQFQGILYLQLLRLGKLNINKLSVQLALKSLQIEQMNDKPDDKIRELVKSEAKKQQNKILTDSIEALVGHLNFSKQQVRMITLLVKCLAGSNESWLYLFIDKMNIFEKVQNQDIIELGKDFLIDLLVHSETILNKQAQSKIVFEEIKQIEQKTIKQIFQDLTANIESLKNQDIIKQFFKLEKNKSKQGQENDEDQDENQFSDDEIEDEDEKAQNEQIMSQQDEDENQGLIKQRENSQIKEKKEIEQEKDQKKNKKKQETKKSEFFQRFFKKINVNKDQQNAIDFIEKLANLSTGYYFDYEQVLSLAIDEQKGIIKNIPKEFRQILLKLNGYTLKQLVGQPRQGHNTNTFQQISQELVKKLPKDAQKVFDYAIGFMNIALSQDPLNALISQLYELFIPNVDCYFCQHNTEIFTNNLINIKSLKQSKKSDLSQEDKKIKKIDDDQSDECNVEDDITEQATTFRVALFKPVDEQSSQAYLLAPPELPEGQVPPPMPPMTESMKKQEQNNPAKLKVPLISCLASFYIELLNSTQIVFGLTDNNKIQKSFELTPGQNADEQFSVLLSNLGNTFSHQKEHNFEKKLERKFSDQCIITIIVDLKVQNLYFYKQEKQLYKYHNQTYNYEDIVVTQENGQETIKYKNIDPICKLAIPPNIKPVICVGLGNGEDSIKTISFVSGSGENQIKEAQRLERDSDKVMGISGLMSIVTLINSIKLNPESLDNIDVISYFLSNISENTLKEVDILNLKQQQFFSKLKENFLKQAVNQQGRQNMKNSFQSLIENFTYDTKYEYENVNKDLEKVWGNFKTYFDKVKNDKSVDIQQEVLPIIMPILKKIFKVFDFGEGKFKNLCDFIYVCYAYFGGQIDIEENSKVWKLLVKDKVHRKFLEDVMLMVTQENSLDDVPSSIKQGLYLIGDALFIGYDVLKNKDSTSIRQFLSKYRLLIKSSIFATLKKVISDILQDKKFAQIVTQIIDFLYTIFDDSENLLKTLDSKQNQILDNIRPVFQQILKTAFNASGKQRNEKFFQNDVQKFDQFKNFDMEIGQRRMNLLKLQEGEHSIKNQLQYKKKELQNIIFKKNKETLKKLDDKLRQKAIYSKQPNSTLNFKKQTSHQDYSIQTGIPNSNNVMSLNESDTNGKYIKFAYTFQPLQNNDQKQEFAFKMLKGKFIYAGIGICVPDRLVQDTTTKVRLSSQIKNDQEKIPNLQKEKEEAEEFFEPEDGTNYEKNPEKLHFLYMLTNNGWVIQGSDNSMYQSSLRFQEDDIIYCTFDYTYGYILFEKENSREKIKITLSYNALKGADHRQFHPVIFLQNEGDEIKLIEDISLVKEDIEYIRDIPMSFKKHPKGKLVSKEVSGNVIKIKSSIEDEKDASKIKATLAVTDKPLPIITSQKEYRFKFRIDSICKNFKKEYAYGVYVQQGGTPTQSITSSNRYSAINNLNKPLCNGLYMISGTGYAYSDSNNQVTENLKFDRYLSNDILDLSGNEKTISMNPANIIKKQLLAFGNIPFKQKKNYKVQFTIQGLGENKKMAIGMVNNYELVPGNKQWLSEFDEDFNHFMIGADGLVYKVGRYEGEKLEFSFEKGDQIIMEIQNQAKHNLHSLASTEFYTEHKAIRTDIVDQATCTLKKREALFTYNQNQKLKEKYSKDNGIIITNYPLEKYRTYEIKYKIKNTTEKQGNISFGICRKNKAKDYSYNFNPDVQQEGIFMVSKDNQKGKSNKNQSNIGGGGLFNQAQDQNGEQVHEKQYIKIAIDAVVTVQFNEDQTQMTVFSSLEPTNKIIIHNTPSEYDNPYYFCIALNGLQNQVQMISFTEQLSKSSLIFTNYTKKIQCCLPFRDSVGYTLMAMLYDNEDSILIRNCQRYMDRNMKLYPGFYTDPRDQIECKLRFYENKTAKLSFAAYGMLIEQEIPILNHNYQDRITQIFPAVAVTSKEDRITLSEIIRVDVGQEDVEEEVRDLKRIQKIILKKMDQEKEIIRSLEDKIFMLDNNMKKIFKSIDDVIEKVKEIQKVYKEDLEPVIDYFKVNKFDLVIFVNQFIPIVVQLVSSSFDKSTSNFIGQIGNSLIHIVNKDFDKIPNEFFQLMKVNPKDAQNIREAITLFASVSKNPLQLLEKKKSESLQFIYAKTNNPVFSDLNKIKDKLDEQGIQPKDMYKLADIDGSGSIDMREFRLYFKKIGIDLSEHRVQEIFSYAKQESSAQSSESQQLDQEEFIKGYEYIQQQSIFLTLESMGISKHTLMKMLAGLVIILLLIFVFIFIGVKAFAIPGTFGAIVNSAFPMLGGGGLAKGNSSDPEKTLNIERIKKTVQESIATIQSGV